MTRSQPAKSVGRALRNWHALVWGLALAGAAAAAALTLVRPPTYESTAVLTLDQQGMTGQGFDLAIQADEFLTQRYVAMATSRPVMEKACNQVGEGCDPSSLSRRIRVETGKAAGIIGITASGPTPEAAAKLTNAVANQLVEENRAQVASALAAQREYLQGELKQLGDRQQALRRQNQQDPSVQADLGVVQNQYSTTYGRLQDLNVEQARLSTALQVRQLGQPVSRPSDPDPVRYLLVGTVGGLTAGFLLALLIERADTRLRSADDLAEAAGVFLVLDLHGNPNGFGMDCHALLVRAAALERRETARDVLLVAASPRHEVDWVGWSLAHAAAAEGNRVRLALTRPPAEGHEVQVEEPGSPGVVVQAPSPRRRRGEKAPPAGDYDLILTCAPPPANDPLAVLLANRSDLAILVGTRGVTDFPSARGAADLLRHTGAQVAGAILAPRGSGPATWRARRRAERAVAAS